MWASAFERSRHGSTPITRADPFVGFSNPTHVLMRVDLPAAFGPTSAVIPPAGSVRSIPASAVTPRR